MTRSFPTSSVSGARRARLLVPVLLAALALTLGAATALADSSPPVMLFVENESLQGYGNYGSKDIYVFSTRMFSEARMFVNGLDTRWRAEYSTSKSTLESGSGVVSSSGDVPADIGGGEENIKFGVLAGPEMTTHEVQHLIPDTHYYAQFVAENAASNGHPTVLSFEFTTLPILEPEAARSESGIPVSDGSGHGSTTFAVTATSPTTARFAAQIETNGAATEYSFGYSTSPLGPFTKCDSGSITVAESFAEPVVNCRGLAPETTYYARLLATNEKGTYEQTKFDGLDAGGTGNAEVSSFVTPTAKPETGVPNFRNVTATSAHAYENISPKHEETHWRFETAESALGPWTAVPGGAGTISQATAEALAEGEGVGIGATLTGLSPATGYYVRIFAENASGEALNRFGEPIFTETRGFGSFTTTGPPLASTLAVHSLHGESLRLIGTVNPNSRLTSAEQTITVEGAPTGGTFTLTLDGQTTTPIAYDAPVEGPGSVRKALESLPAEPSVNVEGAAGGPYTVVFGDTEAHSQIVADGSGLTPSGAVEVAVTQQGGVGYDARYHFQYVGEAQFRSEGEWAHAASTAEVDVGSGTEARFVGADLPGLKAGETYRYRIVATSTFPGNPVVDGEERSLTVPTVPAAAASGTCGNEALRTGASANLPDCRGYEQLTPVDKGGAQELFEYGFSFAADGAAIGEDGDHVALQALLVNWGSGAEAGQSPYFFTREAGKGWRMTAASPQPQTGVDKPVAALFAPDLSSFAFESSFATSTASESKEVEYEVGPPGGPYATAASIPVSAHARWAGASRDFSKLFFETELRTLLGSSTGTRQGFDLYEYTGGEMRQVNVTGFAGGSTIGTCGANIVRGDEEAGQVSSTHAISSDGSRVFFEAVPAGAGCSAPAHLYMRVDGESTVDIGAYRFIAANAEGTRLLLDGGSVNTQEILLYDTESGAVKPLFTVQGQPQFKVSEDLSTIAFVSEEQLTPEAPARIPRGQAPGFIYRYDVPGEKLSFVDWADYVSLSQLSPDGRDLYFSAEVVGGTPGGVSTGIGIAPQVYRYDSGESLIQCMSCASPFDPEPKLISLFGATGGSGGILGSQTGYPRKEFASGNGDYVFFDTPSALVASDVDGEVAPEPGGHSGTESSNFSVSSDVYEWRRVGVDGCTHLQGCLALITNGRGGLLNLFLGTDESGRDAFIYTSSELVPQDDDAAGDIYDARIGGGTQPLPPRPVECEGDACSTPASPPNDATPSSFTFSGAGNLIEAPPAGPAAKAKKAKRQQRKQPRSKHARKKLKRASGRRGKTAKPSRRSK
jgi:hypothetical protein